jgi:hypothetical protein
MWHLLCGVGRAQGAWFEKLVPRYNVRVEVTDIEVEI